MTVSKTVDRGSNPRGPADECERGGTEHSSANVLLLYLFKKHSLFTLWVKLFELEFYVGKLLFVFAGIDNGARRRFKLYQIIL